MRRSPLGRAAGDEHAGIIFYRQLTGSDPADARTSDPAGAALPDEPDRFDTDQSADRDFPVGLLEG
jgi:hypothetical protein